MNSTSSSGGTDAPPPSRQHQEMEDSLAHAAGVDPEFVTLRNTTRDKISEYIESKQSRVNLGGMLPELARKLEEILFTWYPCKTEYYNMAEGEFEPELQIAIQLLRCLNPQNQQLSRLILQHLPFLGTKFDAPPTDMDLASSSRAGMVLPQSGNMGKYLGMKRRLNPKLMQTKEVPKAPKFSCPVCMNELVVPSSTICGHIFCQKCIKASIVAQSKCPTCRRTLSLSDFHRVYLPMTD